ncbi:MAG: SgcJ/EcaC family oxidoreductase [Planctomycetes bacterium]|nr:SgcJ/EcaC family oxidoreductase [Planctomycetota bacterium]
MEREKIMKHALCVLFLCVGVLCGAHGAFAADQAKDKQAIEKSIASYTAAFNAGDSKALASHWGTDAVYNNPLTGTQVEGRDAITKEMAGILTAVKGAKLSVDVQSIQFLSPGVAVEHGTSKLILAKGEPRESTYTAIHVKRDGKWFLDRISEEDVPVILSNYKHLKELEWLIGSWTDGDERGLIKTTCQWTKNKNFIRRSFVASTQDRIDISGMQIIGWDPAAKQIRSWVFDSDGGFAEGTWAKKEKSWYVSMKGTLPDGRKATSTNIFTMIDENQFKWQSINRTVGGSLLPNIDEVVVKRDAAAE